MKTQYRKRLIDIYGEDRVHQFERSMRRRQLLSKEVGNNARRPVWTARFASDFIIEGIERDSATSFDDFRECWLQSHWQKERVKQYRYFIEAAGINLDDCLALKDAIAELEAMFPPIHDESELSPSVEKDDQRILAEMENKLGDCRDHSAATIEERLTDFALESVEDCKGIASFQGRLSKSIAKRIGMHNRAIEVCGIDLGAYPELFDAIQEMEIAHDYSLCKINAK